MLIFIQMLRLSTAQFHLQLFYYMYLLNVYTTSWHFYCPPECKNRQEPPSETFSVAYCTINHGNFLRPLYKQHLMLKYGLGYKNQMNLDLKFKGQFGFWGTKFHESRTSVCWNAGMCSSIKILVHLTPNIQESETDISKQLTGGSVSQSGASWQDIPHRNKTLQVFATVAHSEKFYILNVPKTKIIKCIYRYIMQ